MSLSPSLWLNLKKCYSQLDTGKNFSLNPSKLNPKVKLIILRKINEIRWGRPEGGAIPDIRQEKAKTMMSSKGQE